MQEERRNLSAVGQEILYAARNELYMNLPYLDVALCALAFRDGTGMTLSIATDGEILYYDPAYLAERYLRGSAAVNRGYLHTILHCMLRHLRKKQGKMPELWDLACDIAVESILDDLHYRCLEETPTPLNERSTASAARKCRCSRPRAFIAGS